MSAILSAIAAACAWFVGAIAKALFGTVADVVVKQAEKPDTIQDAQTPEKLKAAVDADVQHQLDELRQP